METAEEKIVRYCGDINDRIKACKSEEAARLLKKRMCRELQENCKSEMIQSVLNYQIDRIIFETFDKPAENNSKMEEQKNV